MESFTPSEMSRKKKEPLTSDEKEKIMKGALELEANDRERLEGKDMSDESVPKWIKENNERLIREDHEIK